MDSELHAIMSSSKLHKFLISRCNKGRKILTFILTITLSLMDLRRLILSLFMRKIIVLIKLITDPLVFYLFYLKLLNAAYMFKFMNVLILY